MSAGTEQARADFATALGDARNTVWFSESSQEGRGRRHRQPSLHRAGVVLAVAAWQAFAQDTGEAILSDLAVPQGHQGRPLYNLVRASTKTAIGRFNTPNARNTLVLFDNVGFSPASSWRFSLGSPPRTYSQQDVWDEIDGWLAVRHRIAHGAMLPASHLVSGRTQDGPSLHRKDAERCIAFFELVVRVTADAANAQFP